LSEMRSPSDWLMGTQRCAAPAERPASSTAGPCCPAPGGGAAQPARKTIGRTTLVFMTPSYSQIATLWKRTPLFVGAALAVNGCIRRKQFGERRATSPKGHDRRRGNRRLDDRRRPLEMADQDRDPPHRIG